MPIFPGLLPYLREAFEQAEPGSEYVITRYQDRNCNLPTQLERIISKAGLKPWPRLFQNLRSTREMELAERWPVHVVCAWIGNSRAIAQQHYLQVTDEHFERAAVAGEAARRTAQQPGVEPGTGSLPKEEPAICGELRGDAIPNESRLGAVGFEGSAVTCW